MMSAMMAIVRVFMKPPLGSWNPGTNLGFAPGMPFPLPVAALVQSFGAYGSSTPRATLTNRFSG